MGGEGWWGRWSRRRRAPWQRQQGQRRGLLVAAGTSPSGPWRQGRGRGARSRGWLGGHRVPTLKVHRRRIYSSSGGGSNSSSRRGGRSSRRVMMLTTRMVVVMMMMMMAMPRRSRRSTTTTRAILKGTMQPTPLHGTGALTGVHIIHPMGPEPLPPVLEPYLDGPGSHPELLGQLHPD